MLIEIKNSLSKGQITKKELLIIIKEAARKISIADFMQSNLLLRQEAESIQTSYNLDLIRSYTNFTLRIKEVKEDISDPTGIVAKDKLNDAVDLLMEQEMTKVSMGELAFWKIYTVISIYTTFIKEEPIHQVGFVFPGGFKVTKTKEKYTCPVKENNKDNPLAVCPFCIAEQDETI